MAKVRAGEIGSLAAGAGLTMAHGALMFVNLFPRGEILCRKAGERVWCLGADEHTAENRKRKYSDHNALRLSRCIPDYKSVLRIILAISLMISVPGLGLTSDEKSVAKAKPATSQGTAAQDDKVIEATIRAKLAKSKIGKDGFKVRVQGGVATWDGTTDVLQHKGAATRMAKTAGAKAVVNNIKVGDAAKQKAADNLDQGRRRVQVKRSDARSQ